MSGQKQTNGNTSHYTVPLLIDGAEITTNTTFDVIDPATDSTVWKASSASVDDVRNAAKAAEAAFPAWAKTKPFVRRDIFHKAADIFEKRTDELVEYVKLETAATDLAAHINVTTAVAHLRQVASDTVAEAGFIPVSAEEGRSVMVVKEPYGVVMSIAAWYVRTILTRGTARGLETLSFRLADFSMFQECSIYPWFASDLVCFSGGKHHGVEGIGAISAMLLGHWLRAARSRSSAWLSQHRCNPTPRCPRRDHGSDRASSREENHFYGELGGRTDCGDHRRQEFETHLAGTGRKGQCHCSSGRGYSIGCGAMRIRRFDTRMSPPEPAK